MSWEEHLRGSCTEAQFPEQLLARHVSGAVEHTTAVTFSKTQAALFASSPFSGGHRHELVMVMQQPEVPAQL